MEFGTPELEKKLREKTAEIAEYYGYQKQARQTIEEMAELTKEIVKLERKIEQGDTGSDKTALLSEIADVQIMLWQLQDSFFAENKEIVQYVMFEKINRQLERIKNDKWMKEKMEEMEIIKEQVTE